MIALACDVLRGGRGICRTCTRTTTGMFAVMQRGPDEGWDLAWLFFLLLCLKSENQGFFVLVRTVLVVVLVGAGVNSLSLACFSR